MVNVKVIALAHFREQRGLPLVHHREGAFGFLLAGKQIHHGADRLGLEVLGFEFQFHY